MLSNLTNPANRFVKISQHLSNKPVMKLVAARANCEPRDPLAHLGHGRLWDRIQLALHVGRVQHRLCLVEQHGPCARAKRFLPRLGRDELRIPLKRDVVPWTRGPNHRDATAAQRVPDSCACRAVASRAEAEGGLRHPPQILVDRHVLPPVGELLARHVLPAPPAQPRRLPINDPLLHDRKNAFTSSAPCTRS